MALKIRTTSGSGSGIIRLGLWSRGVQISIHIYIYIPPLFPPPPGSSCVVTLCHAQRICACKRPETAPFWGLKSYLLIKKHRKMPMQRRIQVNMTGFWVAVLTQERAGRPKMLSWWPYDGSRCPQGGARWPEDGLMMAPRWLKMADDGSRWPQVSSRWP